jgi:hypothetical protein
MGKTNMNTVYLVCVVTGRTGDEAFRPLLYCARRADADRIAEALTRKERVVAVVPVTEGER